MSELIIRAEQGVLAAMLTRTRADLITNNLSTDDFAHPAHQAIYGALRDLEFVEHDSVSERAETVAAIVERPDVDAAWLAQLAEQTPHEDLVVQYARIVVQASFDREVAEFADPYREAAAAATDDASREPFLRLAAALDAQAEVFTPASTIATDADIRLTADLSVQVGEQIRVQLPAEDQVIADIVQHPEQGAIVAPWLDSDVFTSDQRRMTFEIAVSLSYDGDAYDTVTLAWQVQRLRDIRVYDEPQQEVEAPGESDYAYLRRLNAVAVTAGTAVVVGRQLLTDHVQAHLAVTVSATTAEHTTQVTLAAQTHQQVSPMQPPITQAPAADTIRPIEL
ncbi:DnaB-like helicase N-terminal domain-containing protein [Actinoplanes regularis]|uniref:DnaB-like helicase N terminal domain-containing protein n=1 Tax=Actinoplanes regularis TaxID=52697 RepID=A0A238XH43_9ACTN|nr:DnaB-like helicase N-terminal domain-containing protein [Actinoplanes regularis]GIE86834.1 hypothetical protein Are01nite_33140 [Actinoplanes regularis]SNR58326.1 DnaB-like helicase N terminal domain-containing protein [Actinoplanes regularis]